MTAFPSEGQSWNAAAPTVSRVRACCGALLAGGVGGGMLGTCCVWLASPLYDGAPRDMLESVLIQKKISWSDKWIWDKVLEVRALIRREAVPYTVLVYPKQGDVSLYSLSLVYPPLLFMLFPTNTQIESDVGKNQTPRG